MRIDKDSRQQESSSASSQPVAGSPSGLNQRAANENPRANENLDDKEQDNEATDYDIGSEITDGEDG